MDCTMMHRACHQVNNYFNKFGGSIIDKIKKAEAKIRELGWNSLRKEIDSLFEDSVFEELDSHVEIIKAIQPVSHLVAQSLTVCSPKYISPLLFDEEVSELTQLHNQASFGWCQDLDDKASYRKKVARGRGLWIFSLIGVFLAVLLSLQLTSNPLPIRAPSLIAIGAVCCAALLLYLIARKLDFANFEMPRPKNVIAVYNINGETANHDRLVNLAPTCCKQCDKKLNLKRKGKCAFMCLSCGGKYSLCKKCFWANSHSFHEAEQVITTSSTATLGSYVSSSVRRMSSMFIGKNRCEDSWCCLYNNEVDSHETPARVLSTLEGFNVIHISKDGPKRINPLIQNILKDAALNTTTSKWSIFGASLALKEILKVRPSSNFEIDEHIRFVGEKANNSKVLLEKTMKHWFKKSDLCDIV
eukprot:Platyproteum_vivax@DN309_c0_g1_i1.p1